MMIRSALPMIALCALAACGAGDQAGDQDGVGGVSAGEARALNAAAAQLDAQAGAAQSGSPGLNPAAATAARADRNRTAPRPEPRP
ncbi:hypothetical protein Q4610_06935 [Sphingobium sp. HBC34]|uniref:Lipoprotein n=1 Tax=Sphingobium cyanobacteriorum TaxID=3063954 RepID=A0ABT8ZJT5_9SPHN|nr:hypothetical protein [Sphingobium sp. HBC34]MDO7834778.1 hypothetical protein [Sphingobium sp. HBC34]